jgi:protein O-GlcNAc transferase
MSTISAAADRLINEGNRAERAGQLREACALYLQAVGAAPDYGKAHLNLAIALEALGDGEAALASYEAALANDPADPYANYNLGRLRYNRGELRRAEDLLTQALRNRPDFPDACVVLASIYDAQGKLAAAVDALEDALRYRPDYAGALRNYGIVLGRLGRWADAEAAFRRAVDADPADAELVYRLGYALVRQGNLVEAQECYRRAIRLRPEFAEAWCHLGNVLNDVGRHDEGRRCLTKALEIRAEFPEALVGLGNLHNARNERDRAALCYRRALALDDGIADAHVNLAHLLMSEGRREEARKGYLAALAVNPNYAAARWSLAMCSIPTLRDANDDLGRLRAETLAEFHELDQWMDTIPQVEAAAAVGVQQPFWLAYQEHDNREILEPYGRLCARVMARAQPRAPAQRRSAGPLRVAVVSRWFHEHSVWHAIVKGWFQQIDPQRFSLSAFCLGADADEQTLIARSRAARFEQGGRGWREWVDAIRQTQPDVVIYPEIGMDPMSVKLASLRLAPVQVAAWGHPETTGLPTIDFYLSAELMEPEGAQAHYSERLVALPNLGCFFQPAKLEATAPDFGGLNIDPNAALLVSPGAPFKYAPEHDRVFPEIARRIGQCRMVFFSHEVRALSDKLCGRLANAFREAGLDFDQYAAFIPWQKKAAFLELMKRADVFLDTIGFSGFNTAVQALECALPIVTREGRFLRGRLASGPLKRIGLPELVAHSDEEYVEIAVRLARAAGYRRHVRERIVASRALLFEDRAPIHAMERFLSEAVARSPR